MKRSSSSAPTMVFSSIFCLGASLNRYPLNVSKRCISLIFPRSSFHLDSAQMPSFQPWMRSNIRAMMGPGNGGGRSGNRRTSSFKNSLVAIWRWSGYPHDWTSVSRRANANMAIWGFLWFASRATSMTASRGLYFSCRGAEQ